MSASHECFATQADLVGQALRARAALCRVQIGLQRGHAFFRDLVDAHARAAVLAPMAAAAMVASFVHSKAKLPPLP